MSRGRPRHHSSRRRAYSVRQREVRERRERSTRDVEAWMVESPSPADDEPEPSGIEPIWAIGLRARPTAA